MADSVRFDLYDPDEKISFDGWIILSGNNISADADEINFSDAEDVQF